MAEGAIRRNGWARNGRLHALAAVLALAGPAFAESTPAGTTVLGVRAGSLAAGGFSCWFGARGQAPLPKGSAS